MPLSFLLQVLNQIIVSTFINFLRLKSAIKTLSEQ